MIAEILLNLSYPGLGQQAQPATSATPYLNLITSEHNQKPNFMAMVAAVTGAIGDVNAGIQAIQPAFDLDQAIGVQLDILGLWIGQSRIIPDVLLLGYFGFADDEAALSFGEEGNISIGGVWYEEGSAYAGSTVLTDPQYLTVLKARIVRNQSAGNLAAIENALQFIFNAECAVADTGTLSLALTISTPISQTEQALLTSLDLLPRPAGVQIGSIAFGQLNALIPSSRALQYETLLIRWPDVTWNAQHR